MRAGKKKENSLLTPLSIQRNFTIESVLIGSLISLFPSTSACTRFVIVYNSHGITIIDRSSNSTVESQTIITRTLQLQIIASRLRVWNAYRAITESDTVVSLETYAPPAFTLSPFNAVCASLKQLAIDIQLESLAQLNVWWRGGIVDRSDNRCNYPPI